VNNNSFDNNNNKTCKFTSYAGDTFGKIPPTLSMSFVCLKIAHKPNLDAHSFNDNNASTGATLSNLNK
jgi:hypothetical protein